VRVSVDGRTSNECGLAGGMAVGKQEQTTPVSLSAQQIPRCMIIGIRASAMQILTHEQMKNSVEVAAFPFE
jgi:hypothetical protein